MGRHRVRVPFTKAEVGLIWQRWREGVLLERIGRELGRSADAVKYLVVRHGGIAPAERRRSSRVLSAWEREEISRGIVAGESMRGIARRLQRAPSSISREIRRHGGLCHYRAAAADKEAWSRARRPKLCRLATDDRLRRMVEAKLRADWSPQQISGWLRSTFPHDPSCQVSHETIYRTLYVQSRGALKKELVKHLRRGRRVRRSRQASSATDGRGQIVDAVPISQRPAAAADRAVPGHWEGDMLVGTLRSQVATLVERRSRFLLLVRLPNREASTVQEALTRRIQHLPYALKRSLTWDRGHEMAHHRDFTIATNVQVYFCDPQSPWQRGSNENTNGLLRQYFKKGVDLSKITQKQLDQIALKLNTRPRQTLGWQTPAEVFSTAVASTD